MTTEPDTTEPDTTQLEATQADPAPYDDSLPDEEWLAAPQRRSRLRTILVLLLGASLLFLAGTQVQRHFGPSSASSGTAAAFTPPTGGGAAPSGFPGGAAPGGAGTGSGDSGTGASAGTGTGDAGSTSTSSLIGTVVSIKGDRWTVKDLGGKTHVVRVPTSTQVVRETHVAANKVARGSTVDISGSTTGGSLSASTITVR